MAKKRTTGPEPPGRSPSTPSPTDLRHQPVYVRVNSFGTGRSHRDVSSFLVSALSESTVFAVHPPDRMTTRSAEIFGEAGLLPDRQQPAVQRAVVGAEGLPDRVQVRPLGAQDLTDHRVRRSDTAGGVCGRSASLPSSSPRPAGRGGRFPGPRRAIPGLAGPVRRTRSRSGPIAVRRAFSASAWVSRIARAAVGGTCTDKEHPPRPDRPR